jgi:predicted TIM-barrel fold metal-dependent hydrolase
MELINIRATKDQLIELKESILWADITAELEVWKQGFNDEMMSIVDGAADANPSTAAVLLHMGDLNGRQKAVDYLLSLPDVFLQILEDKKPTNKEPENDS